MTRKLYTGVISPMAKRVRICAAELGIALEPALLDFQKGENRSADYLALNPMGKVPTLVDDGLVLWESAAILWHLAQARPGPLYPADAHGQADTLRWMFFGSCHLDPYFTTLVVERYLKGMRAEAPNEVLLVDAEQWLARFVPVVEQHLASREHLTGRFGLADITLGTTLELSPLVGYDLKGWPNIRAWLGRLQARDTWRGPSPESFPAP